MPDLKPIISIITMKFNYIIVFLVLLSCSTNKKKEPTIRVKNINDVEIPYFKKG
jgi:hypothetical protein